MRLPGRVAAAIEVLGSVLEGRQVEVAMSTWARANRFAGSKDRSFIRDIIYDVLRSRQTCARIGGGDTPRGLAIGWTVMNETDPSSVFGADKFGPSALSANERHAIEDTESSKEEAEPNLQGWVFDRIKADWGDAASLIAKQVSQRANVHIRANLQKTDRTELQNALSKDDIITEPVGSGAALLVQKNGRGLSGHPLFEAGHFELQDSNSQAVCAAIPVSDGARVLDYCAGAGGKSLAIAAQYPTVKIDAWDISQRRLSALSPRADRAGARITLMKSEPDPARQKYDLVVLDVPCSGSGSWRRDPQGKWTLTPDRLQSLEREQALLLEKGAELTEKKGTLAYITCSVFRAENDDQIDEFLKKNPDWQQTYLSQWLPEENGDGFFLCLLERENPN